LRSLAYAMVDHGYQQAISDETGQKNNRPDAATYLKDKFGIEPKI